MRAIPCMVLSLFLGGSLFPQAGGNTSQPNVKLTTKISNQKYCGGIYSDMAMLQISLQLTYTNVSPQSLIFYKGSNLIYYILVGSNEQSLENKQYELNMHVGWVTSESRVTEGVKPGNEFTILNPGEAYQTEGNASMPVELEANSKFLKSGTHFLQVVTETWPSSETQLNRLQRKWNRSGVLWGKNVRSEPMLFSVENKPTLVECK